MTLRGSICTAVAPVTGVSRQPCAAVRPPLRTAGQFLFLALERPGFPWNHGPSRLDDPFGPIWAAPGTPSAGGGNCPHCGQLWPRRRDHDPGAFSCSSSSQAPHLSFPPKGAKIRSLRCASSSHRTRFAGLRREPWCVLRRASKPALLRPEIPGWSGPPLHREGWHTASHSPSQEPLCSRCPRSFCTRCRSVFRSMHSSICR